MMTLRFICFALFVFSPFTNFSQTQTIKGRVLDAESLQPMPFVNVHLLHIVPMLGGISDQNGDFRIEGVPVGRYDVLASYVGYDGVVIKDVEVNASKMVIVEILLRETFQLLNEVIVTPEIDRDGAQNQMVLISARMLSVEQSNRYAGGFDDPARLASSFAGVATGVNNNGIVIRGNAPKSLQWKMEGIEIPNPNHFADLQSFGGGALTALSSQLLTNSDFLTGAFPSEYSNALSGVFDMKMRKGNFDESEHTFQIGAMGIDFSSEGPFKKGRLDSYLFNYRYSTFGLVGDIVGVEEGIAYQDLSFKLNFPTTNIGVFSFWGIGLKDRILISEEIDSTRWMYRSDREEYVANQYMVAAGINHKLILSGKSYIQSAIGYTNSNIDWRVNWLDSDLILGPKSNLNSTNASLVFKTVLNTKVSNRHLHRLGLQATNLRYNTLIENIMGSNDELATFVDERGNSNLISAFNSSNFKLSSRLIMNAGLNAQVFTLNNNFTIEPRLSIKWDFIASQTLGFAYGLHSRLEKLNFFFTRDSATNELHNKDMDFTKAHHFVLSYSRKLNPNLSLRIEPYYQILFDVPVVEDSYYSFINQVRNDDWFVNDKFLNIGLGRNYGVDITLERYFSESFYSLGSISVFKSRYRDGHRIWRGSRYDKNFIVNLLAGKEWSFGENDKKTLGVNVRTVIQGGDRYVPYFEIASIKAEEVRLNTRDAFSDRFDPEFILHFSINYKINRINKLHEFALNMLNATRFGDFREFQYNFETKTVDRITEIIMIPNVSYRIEF